MADGVTTFDSDDNLQFTDLTIEAGVTIALNSGTVIRCTGDFVNHGTIEVNSGAGGGFTYYSVVDGDTLTYPYQPPHPGWSSRLPTNGEVAENHGGATGGIGGDAMLSSRWLLWPGIYGGGGGANSGLGAGGAGGGVLVVLVRGTFVNDGLIQANGRTGSSNSGGGGGGIIIIASATEIDNTAGTLEARGGDSRDVSAIATSALGSGGGGGGGLVHLLAPIVTEGTVDVSGGIAGDANPSVSAAMHIGGGGGGACCGNGGSGGDVPAGDPTSPIRGSDGGEGCLIVDELDPTTLF